MQNTATARSIDGYVVRLDDNGSLRAPRGGFVTAVSPDDAAVDYNPDLKKAHVFPSGYAAAEWVKRRQLEWAQTFGGHFSLVPVRIVKTPGVRTVKPRTVQIKDRTYFVKGREIWFRTEALERPSNDFSNGPACVPSYYTPEQIGQVYDLLRNPTEIVATPETTTVELY